MTTKLDLLFKSRTHRDLLRLYSQKDDKFFENMTGLGKQINASHATIRHAVKDLIAANIFRKTYVGGGMFLIQINIECPYAKSLFDLIRYIEELE